MTSYKPQAIEKKWQNYWRETDAYKVSEDSSKPKFYVLDMFPYPSGAGLHVGHPLGYIASDIYARYKRQKGFNVLHPMGFDAFGLPAEQYAIQTGQHPQKTTADNAAVYREQLDNIGFSFDWSRQIKTSDPEYYKWTQWTFIKLFHHWYDSSKQKARPVAELIAEFEKHGNTSVTASTDYEETFSESDWQNWSEEQRAVVLQHYRLAYRGETLVNWCPELGTVLANDEVIDGLSARGGHPVEQKKMKQWSLRITAYAERLLGGLDKLDWPESIKEIQTNWIGKSSGVQMAWEINDHPDKSLAIYTTRPDTIFGATFMVVAPEHPLVDVIVTDSQRSAVQQFVLEAGKRSERDRMVSSGQINGVDTGATAKHPYTGEQLPIWIADYVLMGYGTGAIMAVPAHDSRDYAFAKHFNLKITQVIEGDCSTEALETKDGTIMNSEFLNGKKVKDAIELAIKDIESKGLGSATINFRLRDASFSRQRYWGEPFPVYYRNEQPYTLSLEELPLELPQIDSYLPTADGDPPLARADDWQTPAGDPLELSTMPGFAGSSAYFLRYMDPANDEALVDPEKAKYWGQVDLYMGGKEHATGHLLYARFWNMFLYDLGVAQHEEPFKKLINQGMIQGQSHFVYRDKASGKFVSKNLLKNYDTQQLHVDIGLVKNRELNCEAFKAWREDFKNAEFILEDGRYICGTATEKMSKSYFNVVNPDDVIHQYGADTFRLYEMFLGPIEQSKGWDTQGIEGVARFIKRTWGLFVDDDDKLKVDDSKPSDTQRKSLHTMLKKVGEDVENFSFNTAVSAFMILTNDLVKDQAKSRGILEPYCIALASFAPHIAAELWARLGHNASILDQEFPKFDKAVLVESTFSCPVSINGKFKFTLELPKGMSKDEMEAAVLQNDQVKGLIADKKLKKAVVVPDKIVNLVM